MPDRMILLVAFENDAPRSIWNWLILPKVVPRPTESRSLGGIKPHLMFDFFEPWRVWFAKHGGQTGGVAG
jgi:hypothetical protein